MRYLPHTPADVAAMLEAVGMASLDDLFAHIPASCRMSGDLDLPAPMSEWELNSHMDSLAAENAVCRSFLGAGCYDHYVPSVVTSLLGPIGICHRLYTLPAGNQPGFPAGHLRIPNACVPPAWYGGGERFHV